VSLIAPTPRFSVIVPVYQAAGVLGHCLDALGRQSLPRNEYELIVVDDGSTDDTAAVARGRGADQVLTVPHGGPSAARNAGMHAAGGEIVLFTDADCEPAPDWLALMAAAFADPQVMGAKGAYRTRQRSLIARLVQLEFEIRYGRMARLPRIDFIDTYAAAYRRDLLLRYGGFDTAFPIPSAEDVDLSFRIARDGHLLRFVPAAQVWHRHPASLRHYLARKGLYGYWRALLYLRYPDKISGDAHTDPALKAQFALLALAGVSLLIGLAWRPALLPAAAALVAFFGSTLPFVRWAWRRDRAVALAWPAVTLLRVAVQGCGLALGLLRHGLVRR
jgi:glycosyltransferase involved in cell wall biosynthesis